MPRLLNDDILLEIFKWFASIDDDGPFTIFFLSKAWRQAVIGHPDLWSYIAVDMTREDWQERVHVAITLSQSRPLHLKIVCQGRIHPDFSPASRAFKRLSCTLWTVMNLCQIYTRLPKTECWIGEGVIMHNIGALKWLKTQDWYKRNDPEPPMTASHPLIRDRILAVGARSVFEVYIESSGDKYCCTWAGTGACRKVFGRRDRAVGHVYSHVNYRPIVCHGECGKDKCQARYFTKQLFMNHCYVVRRRITCGICGKELIRVDLKHHMQIHHSTQS